MSEIFLKELDNESAESILNLIYYLSACFHHKITKIVLYSYVYVCSLSRTIVCQVCLDRHVSACFWLHPIFCITSCIIAATENIKIKSTFSMIVELCMTMAIDKWAGVKWFEVGNPCLFSDKVCTCNIMPHFGVHSFEMCFETTFIDCY